MVGLVIHEWAEAAGGAEQVVDQFLEEFPDADLQVLWNDAPQRYPAARETWLANTSFRRSKALALPLMPYVWRRLPIRHSYEWMLVSSHLFAHHARIRGGHQPPKLVYAHTPARYIWEPSLDQRGNSLVARLASSALKPLDRLRAQEATAIAANSKFTRDRVQRAWEREASVIYPPVDTMAIASVADWRSRLTDIELEQLEQLPDKFLLGASRFVPYKRLDLVLNAGEAAELPVVLAGRGPYEQRLRALAAEKRIPVRFVISPSTPMLRALYQRSLAFVFPAIEDFGIMPVEAMAAGTPVIVPSVGGAAESVSLCAGGATFEADSPNSWREAINLTTSVNRGRLPSATALFSNERFRRETRGWVSATVAGGLV